MLVSLLFLHLSSPTPIGDPGFFLFPPSARRKALDPRVRKDDRKSNNDSGFLLSQE